MEDKAEPCSMLTLTSNQEEENCSKDIGFFYQLDN